jgi:hypothetical protein
MADDVRSDTVSPTLSDDEALERLYERANPNPARIGCPPRDTLRALAKRQRPVGDPLYDHLTECSPCFIEVRALQRISVRSTSPSSHIAKWAALAAALLLMVGSATWLWLGASQEATSITADLTNIAVPRSGQGSTSPPPVALPRARITLTLILPTGYEPGSYELSLVDARDALHASASGRAVLRDFVTSLAVTLDLRRVATGPYRLGIRATPGEWLFVPVHVD